MRTTIASKNSWTTRGKPPSSGRVASPPLHSVTASNSSKGRLRRHFAECRTSGRRRRPTKSKPLEWTGLLQRSSSQTVQRPSKHSTRCSPASEKKRICPKNSGMPHSSPCSRRGAVRLTAATTGASLSCLSLGRSWLGSSSTASSRTSRRKTCRSPLWIPSQPQYHQHDLLCTPGAGEVHRTEFGPPCRLHRPDESLRHDQQRDLLGDSVQTGVPDQVREPDSPVPRRHDRTGTFRR